MMARRHGPDTVAPDRKKRLPQPSVLGWSQGCFPDVSLECSLVCAEEMVTTYEQ